MMLAKDPQERASASELMKHKLFFVPYDYGKDRSTTDTDTLVHKANLVSKTIQPKSLTGLKSGGVSPLLQDKS